MKIIRNLLIQYKGGGYDGCHWEWNFFLFDSKGRFHNLMSTGSRGIGTSAGAREKIKSNGFDTPYKYDLKKASKIKEFSRETNTRLVNIIGTAINGIYKKDIIKWECDECGDSVVYPRSENAYPTMFANGEDYGGQTKLCEDCYLNHSCGYCGSFNEPSENNVDEGGHCIYCIQKETKGA